MTALPDLTGALVQLLSGDETVTALVSDRIYGGELPEAEKAVQPRGAIVLRSIPGAVSFGRAKQEYGDRHFDVFCYGETPFDAEQLGRTVYGFFKSIEREKIGGCLIHWIQPAGNLASLRDPDTSWPYTLSSYQVMAAEVVVN